MCVPAWAARPQPPPSLQGTPAREHEGASGVLSALGGAALSRPPPTPAFLAPEAQGGDGRKARPSPQHPVGVCPALKPEP